MFILKNCSSKYDSLSFQSQITFEYLLKRSLRNIQTSNAVGRVGKDKMLDVILSVGERLPEISKLNKRLNIQWSGKFALDGTFFKIKGESHVLLLCSDFESLDLIGYRVAKMENYKSWVLFLIDIYAELTKSELKKFFVTDGKRGLHQAISQLFPNTPTQLCTTHKQRRINQIVPHVRGDGYDKLFAHLAHKAIRAPIKEIYDSYLNVLLDIRRSDEYLDYLIPRQEKLKKIIGALRFQKGKLHTRYQIDEITDTTTNHLEGINSFLQERMDLMRGFKKTENAELLIKLLIYYYRFHRFTSSGFKERNGKCPIELNNVKNQKILDKIINNKVPYLWIRSLLSST